MASRIAVCTIIAKNYLPYARVLMSSVAEWHPDWSRFVILVDRIDGFFDPAKEQFETILSEDLSIPHWNWFHFKYTILELSTAVKPYALEHLFKKYAFERILYLDPDIRLYSSLGGLVADLDRSNIVLTPHLTDFLADEKRPAELDILQSGAYNLGFIGVAASSASFSFLKWWQGKLYDHCVVDIPRGLFVDQRWVDLVPGLFEGVLINREPQYNVAYWNLLHRRITRSPRGFEVSGAPLGFFHFSGFDPDRPDKLSRHQDRFCVSDLPEAARELLLAYREELLNKGYAKCRAWPYAFGSFANGTPIPDMGRPVHHEAPQIADEIEDPFSDEGFQAFVRVWNAPILTEGGNRSGVSRLAYRIYRTREDVQAAMPDIFGGDLRRFLEWMLSSGKREHALEDVFLTTIRDAARVIRERREEPAPITVPAGEAAIRELARHGVSSSVWFKYRTDGGQPGTDINQLIEKGGAGLRLTRLARAIYESRAELQPRFPDPCGRDAIRFLVWLLSYGRKEHNLIGENLAPLEAQWHDVLRLLPGWGLRLRYRVILRVLQLSVQVRALAARFGTMKAKLQRGMPLPGAPNVTGSPLSAAPSRLPAGPAVDEEKLGVNLVGYFRSETGVGQSARAAILALREVELPFSLKCLEDPGPSRKGDHSVGLMSAECPYPVNVFHVNADQSPIAACAVGEEFMAGRQNVGFWHWELEEFPDCWVPSFAQYQEIWTPSTFCRNSFARKSPIPVWRVPHAIRVVRPTGVGRAHFGLPPDKFIFLCSFDVLSVVERKNPLGAVRAFEMAFGSGSGCILVLKANNARYSQAWSGTLSDMAISGSIRVIDQVLTRSETDALTGVCDCLVSLHRSEGFGLVLAEAMYLGKPVIATDYSGNTDFTKPGNSFLVRYKMKPVGFGCEPYDRNSVWADPDIEEAARHMRTVREAGELREKVAREGQQFVSTFLSPKSVGGTIKKRLEHLQRCRSSLRADGHVDPALAAEEVLNA